MIQDVDVQVVGTAAVFTFSGDESDYVLTVSVGSVPVRVTGFPSAATGTVRIELDDAGGRYRWSLADARGGDHREGEIARPRPAPRRHR